MKKLLVAFAIFVLAPLGCQTSDPAETADVDSLVAGADASAAGSLLDVFGSFGDGTGGFPGPFGEGGGPFGDVTEEQRTQIAALREQLEAGAITFEDFRTQVEAIIGQPLPEHGGPFGEMLSDLTEEQRTQLRTLHDQLRNGEITFEEFRTQAEAITGTEFPDGPPHGIPGGPFGRGGGFGHGGGFGGGFGGPFGAGIDLTDEQRSQIEALVTQLRNGEIDRAAFHEQARAILEAAK